MSDIIQGFKNEGNWYKGNLHCHTTVSDGVKSPADTIGIYKRNGYDFLALTEHLIYSNWKEYNTDDFLILPGTELHIKKRNYKKQDKAHHILGISKDIPDERSFKHLEEINVGEWKDLKSVQNVIEILSQKNNIAIYAHPVWSKLELRDFMGLKNYAALEIYNHICEYVRAAGYAELYWDSLLRRGRRIYGIASDDAHFEKVMCRAWVMVKAGALSVKDIVSSLCTGDFYSSTGPEIYDYKVTGDKVSIECSKVKSIRFITYEYLGSAYHSEGEKGITGAVHKLNGCEKYVRVECVDHEGKKAWSNPIFI